MTNSDLCRILLEARTMTYTSKNVLSAFEATGIHPLNARRVLNTLSDLSCMRSKAPKSPPSIFGLLAPPRTPHHGKSILTHTRKTMALFQGKTPQSAYRKMMVKKLADAAAKNTAENIILHEEIRKLREKSVISGGLAKIKSRKVLTKALVVSVEIVLELRAAHEEKERKALEKAAKAAAKKKINSRSQALPTAKKKALASQATREVEFVDMELDSDKGSRVEESEEEEEYDNYETEDNPILEEVLSPYIERARKTLQDLRMKDNSSCGVERVLRSRK